MIPLTEEQKQNTIDSYLADLEQARQLRDHLEKAGPEDKHKEADGKVTELNEATEKLLIQKLQEWRTDADSFLPQLANLSDQAQKAIDKVKKSIGVAKSITEAFSALDKVIGLARSITFG
jgi:hypothetical protein